MHACVYVCTQFPLVCVCHWFVCHRYVCITCVYASLLCVCNGVYTSLVCVCVTAVCMRHWCESVTGMYVTDTYADSIRGYWGPLRAYYPPGPARPVHSQGDTQPPCVCVFALCLLHRTMCVQCCTYPCICRIILIHKMKLTVKTTLRTVGGPGP